MVLPSRNPDHTSVLLFALFDDWHATVKINSAIVIASTFALLSVNSAKQSLKCLLKDCLVAKNAPRNGFLFFMTDLIFRSSIPI